MQGGSSPAGYTPLQEEYERGHDGHHMAPPAPRRRRSWFLVWVLCAVVLCAALGAGLSYFFSGATITIEPRTASVAPGSPITAQLLSAAQTSAAPAGALGFETITVLASTTRAVPASGTHSVNTYAQGTITIYNKYSTAPQTLVATTRFETSGGAIYRIHATITVPGATKQADGSLTPGSVDATAYADAPGPSYNTGAAQFSIPGFKGKPQYNGFYATTGGIGGGASGVEPVVLPADSKKAQSDMQAELKNTLMQRIQSQVPPGFILIPGAFAISYGAAASQVPSTGSGQAPSTGSGQANGATLTESASLSAAIVKSTALASAAATAAVDGYTGQPIDFADPSQVPLATTTSYRADSQSIDLSFTAPAVLVWQIDQSQIAAALAGKPKSNFDALMQTFKPAVAKGAAAIHPFWLNTFPSDPAKIKVTINSGS